MLTEKDIPFNLKNIYSKLILEKLAAYISKSKEKLTDKERRIMEISLAKDFGFNTPEEFRNFLLVSHPK